MNEKFQNVEVNSPHLESISDIKGKVELLKSETSKGNPLRENLHVFEESPFFQKTTLKKGDYLFSEGDIDNNLYIIKNGILSVEKKVNSNESTQLSILKSGDFLGEGGFDKESSPKDVTIIALNKTNLLKIDLQNNFKKFIEAFPSIGFEVLKHIISETNKRLIESNRLFASSVEIEQTINSIKDIDTKTIFNVVDKIKLVVDADYILYFEKHVVMPDILTLKYDSRRPGKMLDIIFERKGYFLDLEELYEKANIGKDDKIIINKVSIGDEVYGFLILGREKRTFNFGDKKIISGASNSIAGIIKKYLHDKENKNKVYITEMKKD